MDLCLCSCWRSQQAVTFRCIQKRSFIIYTSFDFWYQPSEFEWLDSSFPTMYPKKVIYSPMEFQFHQLGKHDKFHHFLLLIKGYIHISFHFDPLVFGIKCTQKRSYILPLIFTSIHFTTSMYPELVTTYSALDWSKNANRQILSSKTPGATWRQTLENSKSWEYISLAWIPAAYLFQ